MIVYDCIQGTQEWLSLRAGIPTASNFDRIVTASGKPSKSAEKYMLTLLAERLMGHPCIEAVSRWMDRGTQMEADAVSFYEFQQSSSTTKVGFVTNDAATIGASPDRFVGTDGLLEIKVPSEAVHMAYLLQVGGAYEDYRVQVQGQLWICERQWSDILSYHPELPPAIHRTERDEDFIGALSESVRAFSARLDSLFLDCVQRGFADEAADRKAKHERFSQLSTIDWMRELMTENNKVADD